MFLALMESNGSEVIAVRTGADATDWRAVGDARSHDIVKLAARGDDLDLASLSPLAEPGRLRAPVRPGKIVAIGLNYMDHIREVNVEPPARPLVFSKFTSSIIGTEESIVIDPALSQRVDWEVELAVIIGREARHVSAGDALRHVAAYTIANDVSARDIQFSDGQWVRGKSLDTFCPLGPWLVSADAVTEPQALGLTTKVNGELVQSSSTSEMLFGVRELIAFCSASFTLEVGDVLLTGTPWGCGEFMDPPRSLRDGDVVECEIEGIGVLRNPVRGVPRGS